MRSWRWAWRNGLSHSDCLSDGDGTRRLGTRNRVSRLSDSDSARRLRNRDCVTRLGGSDSVGRLRNRDCATWLGDSDRGACLSDCATRLGDGDRAGWWGDRYYTCASWRTLSLRMSSRRKSGQQRKKNN